MQVMQISGLDKKRMRIFLEDGRSFVLYRGEVRRYSLEEGAELSAGQYEEICSEILKKRARRRTMHLLEKICQAVLNHPPFLVVSQTPQHIDRKSVV